MKHVLLFIPLLVAVGRGNLAAGERGGSLADVCRSGAASFTVHDSITRNPRGERGFLYPRRFVVDSRGYVFMLNFREKTIAKYGRDGTFVGEFGREGEGPGEMRLPTDIELDGHDNITTYDAGNRRFTVFNNDGDLLRTMEFSEISYNRMEGFRIASDGTYFVEIREPDFAGDRGGTAVKLVRYREDLSDRRVVVEDKVKDYVYEQEGSALLTIPLPFNAEFHWDIAPDGTVVIARSASYEIVILDQDLHELHRFRHPGTRVRITPEDREHWLASVGPGDNDDVRRRVEFPREKPFFFRLAVDHEGFIVVVTYARNEDSTVCDVFATDGTYVGAFDLPTFLSKGVFHAGFVYGWKGFDDGEGGRVYSLNRYTPE